MALATYTDGGAFFKAEDYTKAVALLFLVNDTDPSAPDPFNAGNTRLEVRANLSVFWNNSDLDGDPEDKGEVSVTNGVLAKELARYVGEEVAVTVGKPSGKKYWKFTPTDPSVTEKVAAYIEKRDAEDDLDNL